VWPVGHTEAPHTDGDRFAACKLAPIDFSGTTMIACSSMISELVERDEHQCPGLFPEARRGFRLDPKKSSPQPRRDASIAA
jgi:hypothetical protein